MKKNLKLTYWQTQVFNDKHRFKVINCGRRCLAKDTKVWSKNSLVRIQDLKIGDEVWSWSEKYKYQLKKINNVFKYAVDYDPKPMISFRYGKETIKSTYDHPYFYKGRYTPIFKLVWGELEECKKSKLKLLCKQYGKDIDYELEGFKENKDNETSTRRMWLSSHRNRLLNSQSSQNCSNELFRESRKQTSSESQKWNKERQQGGESRVGNKQGKFITRNEEQSSSQKLWREKFKFKDNRETGNRDNKIFKDKQSLWFSHEFGKEDGNNEVDSCRYKMWKDLDIFESEETYCIEVEENHNFFIGDNALLTHNSGKSWLVSVEILRFATEKEKSIVWYVSPTYKQSKAIMWSILKELVPPEAISKTNETELYIELLNGSQIFLKGADSPDSLRGVRIDLCIFDETAFIDKWEEVWKVIRPTLADSKADVWFISTPNGFNHFKELSEINEPDWSYHHYTTYDNPHIPREEIESMKKEMDEDSFAQEIMGEFRKMSGLIYKDFNRDIHMVDIPDLYYNYTYTRALDFGFAHKTALGYFAISYDGTSIYCYDGIYQSGLTENQIADIVKTKDAGRYITNPVADSAQPMSIQQLSELGAYFSPVDKGPDSVKNGIAKVAELLRVRADTGKPTLMFNKNLTWIADEFEKYRWLSNKSDGNIKEIPYKADDDAMDMIRYFAMSYMKPQEYLPVRDKSKWIIE